MTQSNRWFGPSWHAGFCAEEFHTVTPVGDRCLFCGDEIEEDDQGLVMPSGDGLLRPAHIQCLLENAGQRATDNPFIRPRDRFIRLVEDSFKE
jgi:hypothetical protein